MGSLTLLLSWVRTCLEYHPRCHKTFGRTPRWFPDRLIHISYTQASGTTEIRHTEMRYTARIVLESEPCPPEKIAKRIRYISLSHCWGPPPDPSAPLGGRADCVPTKSNQSTPSGRRIYRSPIFLLHFEMLSKFVWQCAANICGLTAYVFSKIASKIGRLRALLWEIFPFRVLKRCRLVY